MTSMRFSRRTQHDLRIGFATMLVGSIAVMHCSGDDTAPKTGGADGQAETSGGSGGTRADSGGAPRNDGASVRSDGMPDGTGTGGAGGLSAIGGTGTGDASAIGRTDGSTGSGGSSAAGGSPGGGTGTGGGTTLGTGLPAFTGQQLLTLTDDISAAASAGRLLAVRYVNGAQATELTGLDVDSFANVGASRRGNLFAYTSQNGTSVRDMNLTEIAHFDGSPESGDRYEWSSDSRYIYCGWYLDGIYRIDTAGGTSEELLVSYDRTYDHSVAVSPDGSALAWGHHEYGTQLRIYVVKPTRPSFTYADATVVWSGTTPQDEPPLVEFLDNDRFLFMINDPPANGQWVGHVYEADLADGGALREVFKASLDSTLNFQPIDTIALSHDRRRLAVLGVAGLKMVDTSTWQATEFHDDGMFYGSAAAWAPEDQYLAVAGQSGDVSIEIWAPDGSGWWRFGDYGKAFTSISALAWMHLGTDSGGSTEAGAPDTLADAPADTGEDLDAGADD